MIHLSFFFLNDSIGTTKCTQLVPMKYTFTWHQAHLRESHGLESHVWNVHRYDCVMARRASDKTAHVLLDTSRVDKNTPNDMASENSSGDARARTRNRQNKNTREIVAASSRFALAHRDIIDRVAKCGSNIVQMVAPINATILFPAFDRDRFIRRDYEDYAPLSIAVDR